MFACICCICLVGTVGFAVYADDQGWLDTATPDTAAAVAITPTQPFIADGATKAAPTITPAPADGATPTSDAVGTTAVEETAVSTPTPPSAPLLTHLTIPKAIAQQPVPANGMADLTALYEANYPVQEYYETAVRMSNRDVGSRTVSSPAYAIGDTQTFIADDEPLQAGLVYATEHIYFWMEDGLNLNKAEMVAAADRLENLYYPQLTTLFGNEWQPGIDGDPHFSIVHIEGDRDAGELGWFTDANEYPDSIFEGSNEQEMLYLVMSNLDTDEQLYDGTLVHEVQHLIQWHVDANETSWMNEGLSQLAEIYMGLDTVETYDYLIAPETRLNAWDNEVNVDAHYANAYLYALYIWEQLGDSAVQALSRHPANGLAGVRAVLAEFAPDRSIEQFTADWAAANYLDSPTDGRYGYAAIDIDDVSTYQKIEDSGFSDINEIDPFGVHYIELKVDGGATVSFVGDSVVPLIDNPPVRGQTFWYAPSVSNMNAVLQRPFNLSTLNSATLTFDAWYDLEEDWDFTYLSVSEDGGASWELLVPDKATPGEFGPGWNGRSADEREAINGWVNETVSLNSYVGKEIILRFDLLTDSAINGRGFAVDNFAIAELGYADDLETESVADGWEAAGFVQTGWQLPQQWSVQWTHDGVVEVLSLNALNQGEWVLGEENGRFADSVLIIMPQTPFVDQTAKYWLQVTP
jgi:hypothetical protein